MQNTYNDFEENSSEPTTGVDAAISNDNTVNA